MIVTPHRHLAVLVTVALAWCAPPALAQTRATDRVPEADTSAPAGSAPAGPAMPGATGDAPDAHGPPRVVGPGSPGSTSGDTQPTGDERQGMAIVMLVPVETASKAVASGCWVRLYDERDFKGDMLTVAGPTELQAMDDASGRAFKRRIDSLTVGPKATLTVYEHRLFKDRSAIFGPDSREAGLARKLGFGGRIQSMRVDCASS